MSSEAGGAASLEQVQERGRNAQSHALARALVANLAAAGVRHVLLCPGSRSAPLAYALAVETFAHLGCAAWSHVVWHWLNRRRLVERGWRRITAVPPAGSPPARCKTARFRAI